MLIILPPLFLIILGRLAFIQLNVPFKLTSITSCQNSSFILIARLSLAIPEGYAGFVQPRSGLAVKNGITVLNTPGLIDSGYRGELKVLLINTDPTTPFEIVRGERIAQLVIQKVEQVEFVEMDSLPSSERGEGGFGSTGLQ